MGQLPEDIRKIFDAVGITDTPDEIYPGLEVGNGSNFVSFVADSKTGETVVGMTGRAVDTPVDRTAYWARLRELHPPLRAIVDQTISEDN